MRKQIFCASLLIFSLYGDGPPILDDASIDKVEAPWFTGPIFAPTSVTIPPGHYNLEPYIFVVANTASYNNDWKSIHRKTFWSSYFQPLVQFGITEWMDSQFYPTLYYNYTKGAGKWVFGDLPIQIGIQLYKNSGGPTDWITTLKLNLKETFPTGKYQKLDPKKLGTDEGGQGSWQTAAQIVWGNLMYLGKGHFLSTRVSFQYNLPAPVHVKNLNAYGGGPGTDGTAYPGQSYFVDIAGELSLTQNWVFAIDILGNWTTKSRFKGKTLVKNTLPASVQYSLAPAIEYNWNANLGIIFGPWFTVAGRNTFKFTSGIFALNYYH